MKFNRPIKSMLIAAAALALSSCYYDSAYGGYYGSSYGTSGISASFVSTGSSYWYYDPVVRCYYDRRRSCYYDPYLYGYYPRGYRPRPIYNCPHPYGWGGKGHAPVPNGINSRTLNQKQDRVAQLQARNYSWARQARVGDYSNEGRRQARQAPPIDQRANQRQSQSPQFQSPGRQGGNRGQDPTNLINTRGNTLANQEAARTRSAQMPNQAAQNQAAFQQQAVNNQAQRAAAMRAARESQAAEQSRASRAVPQGRAAQSQPQRQAPQPQTMRQRRNVN